MEVEDVELEVVPELVAGVYEVVVVVDVVDSTFDVRFIAIASTVPRTKLPFAKLEETI